MQIAAGLDRLVEQAQKQTKLLEEQNNMLAEILRLMEAEQTERVLSGTSG